ISPVGWPRPIARRLPMAADLLLRLADDFLAWCDYFGISLFDWQREVCGEAPRREAGAFVHPLGAVSVARGNGKSFGSAAVGAWRLTAGRPPQAVRSGALGTDGATV